MTSPPDDTTTDTSAIIAALRAERDAALAREAALAEELAARTAELATQQRIRRADRASGRDHRRAEGDVGLTGDAQPVFDLIVRQAAELCDADRRYDGELVHVRCCILGAQIDGSRAAYASTVSMAGARIDHLAARSWTDDRP